jgi:hypothetical protein
LTGAPVLMPSTCRRPSFSRPPAPPKTDIPGVTCTSRAPGVKLACEMRDGMSCMIAP